MIAEGLCCCNNVGENTGQERMGREEGRWKGELLLSIKPYHVKKEQANRSVLFMHVENDHVRRELPIFDSFYH